MSERQFRRAAARRLEESARRNRVAAGVAAGAGAVVLFAPAADAATFMVTSLADDGSVGTLRTAIETANTTPGADTITFASGLSGTIQLNDTDGAIEINSDPLDIQGPGPSQLTVRGDGNERLFTLYNFNTPGDTVIFSGLTLTVTRRRSRSRRRQVDSRTRCRDRQLGANRNHTDSAGLYLAPSIRLADQDEQRRRPGDHLYAAGDRGADATSMTIDSVTRSTGSATLAPWSSLKVSASTFTNNTSTGGGGAIEFWGTGGPVVVENSTFTGNSAGDITSNYDGGGAISSYNAEDLPRTVRNSTIVGNTSAAEGGGIVRNSEDSPTYAGARRPDVEQHNRLWQHSSDRSGPR